MNDKQILKNKKNLLPGSGVSYHQFDKPQKDILNTFISPLKKGCIVFTTKEMTALCPLTSFPDQYSVEITYVPNKLCIESKSAKHYFGAFRDYQGFIEMIAQKIYDDWFEVLQPKELIVNLVMNPRGGVAIEVNI